jgi:hypothetical protein
MRSGGANYRDEDRLVHMMRTIDGFKARHVLFFCPRCGGAWEVAGRRKIFYGEEEY